MGSIAALVGSLIWHESNLVRRLALVGCHRIINRQWCAFDYVARVVADILSIASSGSRRLAVFSIMIPQLQVAEHEERIHSNGGCLLFSQ